MAEPITNPILNSPYDPPEQHFVVGHNGPTGEIRPGRRPSESFIPIAPARKGRGFETGFTQEAADFDLTGERRERNPLINDLRREVEVWRQRRYPRVTPTTRKLLEHWADPRREDRVLFCQREAAETAIFLAEVAGRRGGYRDWQRLLAEEKDSPGVPQQPPSALGHQHGDHEGRDGVGTGPAAVRRWARPRGRNARSHPLVVLAASAPQACQSDPQLLKVIESRPQYLPHPCVIYLRVTVHEQVPEPGGILQPGGQRLLQQSSFAERGERVGECPRRLQPF